MFNRIRMFAGNALCIRPQDRVPQEVARNFQHNVLFNTLDLMAFFFSDSFVSINTIMPVFAATLTDNPVIIGLMPAIANAGWFLPQLFLAGYVSRQKRVLPLALRLSVIERLPYLVLAVFALMVSQLSKSSAVALLVTIMTFRGLGSGLVALPWQELMAKVIPITHRSRFFGFSRVLAQTMGIIGSAIAVMVLSRLAYPLNYAVGFLIAVVSQWISFGFFSQNREPANEEALSLPQVSENNTAEVQPVKAKMVDFELFGKILRTDKNLQRYLIARSLIFVGAMGSAFLAVYGLKRFSLDDGAAAIFTGLIFGSGIIGNALFGAIGDRIGPKKLIMIAQLIWAAAVLIVLSAQTAGLYYLVFILFGLNNAAMVMGDAILVMELGEKKHRTTYLGLTRSLTGAFLLLAPFLAGWLVESFGYPAMFGVSMAFTMLGILLFARVKDRPRHREVVEEALVD